MRTRLIFFSLMACLLGCSSAPRSNPSNLTAAAFAGDGMMYDKPMPEHEYQRFEFYYKHCSLMDQKPYVSEIEYECSNPF